MDVQGADARGARSDRGARERKVARAWGVEARRAMGAWECGGLDAVGAWECSARCRYSRAQGRVACVFGSARAKNDARLRFNSESGSSLKSRKSSTCGFVNASCPDTEPARFKTQTCGFFGPPGAAEPQTALGSKEKRPAQGVFQSRRAPGVRRNWRPARSVPQLRRVLGHGGLNHRGRLRASQSCRALSVAGAPFRVAS